MQFLQPFITLPNGQTWWFGSALPSQAGDGQFYAGDYFFVMTSGSSPGTNYRCITGGTGATAVFVPADGGANLLTLAASGAINPNVSGSYVITKAGVAALTLAAPTVTTSDGVTITVTSNTAFAHTITATGLLQTGGTTTDVATFAAHPGATVTLQAYQGKWNVISANGITFS